MGLIKRFQKWARESRYATWQIYVCVISVLSFISLSIELDFVIEFLQWLDRIHIVNGRSADEVTTAIFQSVLTGAFAYFTYNNGDRYFKSNITKKGLFDSKETAFL